MTRPPLGRLLDSTVHFYRANAMTLLTVGFCVSAFVELVIAAALGELGARYSATSSIPDVWFTLGGTIFVITPLMTAIVACAVRDDHAGRGVSLRRAVTDGLDVFAHVLVVSLLYLLAVLLGAFAFIVPGIFLLVALYFGPLAVVFEGARGGQALGRSLELLRNGWFHAATTGVVFSVLVGVTGQLVLAGASALAKRADAQAVVIGARILLDTVSLPFVVAGASLYFLGLTNVAKAPAASEPVAAESHDTEEHNDGETHGDGVGEQDERHSDEADAQRP